uniref:Uncharacterized protein n=1 Tax=Parascaris univalens TaxID=6257 RepID=A0A915CCW1_PARUN
VYVIVDSGWAIQLQYTIHTRKVESTTRHIGGYHDGSTRFAIELVKDVESSRLFHRSPQSHQRRTRP